MFRFKRFEVEDEHCAMKVGTDGVLLGAWARVEDSMRILDVGTGTGLIALMAAQRNAQAQIVALDIEHGAVCEAQYNVRRTPWAERIDVVCCDVRSYSVEQRFDHIVSNPPYFIDSLPSPDTLRAVARHTSSLGYGEMVDAAQRLLTVDGRLSIVLPTECAARFRYEAFGRLWLTRLLDVSTREGEAPKRTLMEFQLSEQPLLPRCHSLVIHNHQGGYSDEYRLLTEEFYLGF